MVTEECRTASSCFIFFTTGSLLMVAMVMDAVVDRIAMDEDHMWVGDCLSKKGGCYCKQIRDWWRFYVTNIFAAWWESQGNFSSRHGSADNHRDFLRHSPAWIRPSSANAQAAKAWGRTDVFFRFPLAWNLHPQQFIDTYQVLWFGLNCDLKAW